MKTPWKLSRYLPIAQRFIARGRLPALLLAVTRKSASQGGRLGGLKAELRVLLALCNAWWRGDYPGISKQAMLSVVAALLYFLSPIDAIPDVLLGFGFIDDIAVLGWLLRTWSSELDEFRAWLATRTPAQQEALLKLPSSVPSVKPE